MITERNIFTQLCMCICYSRDIAFSISKNNNIIFSIVIIYYAGKQFFALNGTVCITHLLFLNHF